MTEPAAPLILTIGHSTRPFDVFLDLLQRHAVTLLVDIRTVPRSRRHPWFSREALPDELAPAGIGYAHLGALGGLRKPCSDSPNTGLRNESFRGYADYMQTAEFAAGVQALLNLARERQAAVMCAEAVPWRCHRSLLADALTARDVPVAHIIGPEPPHPHRLTPWARLDGLRVLYPPEGPSLFELNHQARLE